MRIWVPFRPSQSGPYWQKGRAILRLRGSDFMLDFAVDDLDAFLTRLNTKGVTIIKREDSDPIELWQPTKR